MDPILKGVLLGLTLSIMIGPALFALIQTSIHRGFKAGAKLAIGISLSDITVLLLCYFGVSRLLISPENRLIVGIIGGIILISFGIYTFIHKPQIVKNNLKDTEIKFKGPKSITYILKGYFLNITNPGVWALWVTAMAGISATFGPHTNSVIHFFIGTLVTVLSTDITKCFIANKIKRHLNIKYRTALNRFVGVILIFFGLVIMAVVIFHIKI